MTCFALAQRRQKRSPTQNHTSAAARGSDALRHEHQQTRRPGGQRGERAGERKRCVCVGVGLHQLAGAPSIRTRGPPDRHGAVSTLLPHVHIRPLPVGRGGAAQRGTTPTYGGGWVAAGAKWRKSSRGAPQSDIKADTSERGGAIEPRSAFVSLTKPLDRGALIASFARDRGYILFLGKVGLRTTWA